MQCSVSGSEAIVCSTKLLYRSTVLNKLPYVDLLKAYGLLRAKQREIKQQVAYDL
jgi:hypothetical protein